MDPVKQDGKVREQAERENSVRRKYPTKWGEIANKEFNKFYNQNTVSKEIRESGFEERCPYQYTGHGDSYFVSKDMYDSLVAKCRCGRPKSDGHIIKCLQKVQNKYLEDVKTDDSMTGFDNGDGSRKTTSKSILEQDKIQNNSGSISIDEILEKNKTTKISPSDRKSFLIRKVPETSCGMVGWKPNRYAVWERSTHYISPKTTMPGHKIDDHPYSSIIIG